MSKNSAKNSAGNSSRSSTIATAQTRVRWLAAIVIVWLLLLLVMMGWWAWIVQTQAEKIAELQTLAGLSSSETQAAWMKTHRMLMWEAGAFVVLLTGLSGVMAWLYWRDRRRSKALQAFLASVTHELKTPLTSIRLQAEALGEKTPQDELVDRLLEDTSRLEAQVEKTLELARLEGGGQLMLQALPLGAWLDRFRKALQHPETIMIEPEAMTKLAERRAVVMADPNALQIVFRNVIENTVRHSQAASPQVHLTIEDRPHEFGLIFADEGLGFSGDRRRLGSLFFRGSRSQGAGVGLYLIQRLMSRMRGRAEFDAPPGNGFVTRLYFRRAEEHA